MEKIKLLGFDTATCGKLKKNLKIQIDKENKLKQLLKDESIENGDAIFELYSLLKNGFNSFEDSRYEFLSQVSLIENSTLVEMDKFKKLINYEGNDIKRLVDQIESKSKELYKLKYIEELMASNIVNVFNNEDNNLYSKIKIEISQKKDSISKNIEEVKLKIYKVVSRKVDLSTVRIRELDIKPESVSLPNNLNISNEFDELIHTVSNLALSEDINTPGDLDRLPNVDDLEFPNELDGRLYLDGLTSAEGLVLPDKITDNLNLNNLANVDGLVLPRLVSIDMDNWQKDLVKPFMFTDLILSSDDEQIRNVLLEEYTLSGICDMSFLEYIKNSYPMYSNIIEYEEITAYRNSQIEKCYLEYLNSLENKSDAIPIEEFVSFNFGWEVYSTEDENTNNKKIG